MPLTAGPVARAQAALERAQALQPELGAFVELTPQLALAQARQAEEELAAGRSRGPLHGLPVAVKDVIDVAGLPTRLGAARPDERVVERNALVVDALVAAAAALAPDAEPVIDPPPCP